MYIPPNSFKRLYTLDFTAQPTQNLIAGGNFTIDGYTWTVENQGNASSFTLTNGTGLVINANSGTQAYQPNNRLAPLIRSDLSNFVPQLAFGQIKALRFKSRVLLTNANTNFQVAHLFLEWSTTPIQIHMVNSRGSILGNIRTQNGLVADATPSVGTDTETRDGSIITNDDVEELIWRMEWIKESRHSLYSSGFPQNTTYQSSQMAGFGTNIIRDSTSSNIRMGLCAAPTSAGSSFTATWTNLTIDQMIS